MAIVLATGVGAAEVRPRHPAPFPGNPRDLAGVALDPESHQIWVHGGIGPRSQEYRHLEIFGDMWVYDLAIDRCRMCFGVALRGAGLLHPEPCGPILWLTDP